MVVRDQGKPSAWQIYRCPRTSADPGLFRLGIVGAVPAPRSPTTIPNRSLAPSPPIISSDNIPSSGDNIPSSSSTINSPSTPTLPSLPMVATADIHDVGFTIYTDESLPGSYGVGIGTPDSHKHRTQPVPNPPLALDAIGHVPSSPASSCRSYGSLYDENQENIPPAPYASSSNSGSPSKYPASLCSTPSHVTDEEYYLSTGSGRKRTIERSKLATQSIVRQPSGTLPEMTANEEDDELTPGKRTIEKGKGKAQMAQEVDEV